MAELQAPAGYDASFYSPFYYPAWTAMFFAPLGYLPLRWAAAVWQTLNQALLLVALRLVALGMRWRPSSAALGLTLTSGLLFHPALVAFLNGQLSILILALLSGAYCLLQLTRESRSALAAGVLLAAMAIKPQLAAVPVAVLFVYVMIDHRWMVGLGLVATLTCMLVASLLLVPGWVGVWLADREGQWGSSRWVPTVWGLAHDVSPDLWLWLGGLASAVLLGGMVAMWWRHRRSGELGPLLAITVAVGLLVLPFTWVYDQALLLLAFVVAMGKAVARRNRVLWWAVLCGWGVVLPYALYALSNVRGRETANAFLPISMLCIVIGLSWEARRPFPRKRAGRQG
jgi:hypothetical protein